MKKTLAAALAISVTGSAAMAQDFGAGSNRVVTFGDSLSDNGNLYAKYLQPTSPPYNHRFTNGLTFAEYLNGSMLGYGATDPTKNINYAFGGARTDSITVTVNNNIPGTQDQIKAYTDANGTFGQNTLVTWLAGGNNLFDVIQNTADPTQIPGAMAAAISAAARDAAAQFQLLASKGAKTILVYKLPDMGLSPAGKSNGSAMAALATSASDGFNAALDASARAVAAANPGVNFIEVDLTGFLRTVVANPAAFGFTNVTDPCVSGTTVCADPSKYLFWDGKHPTDAANKLVATYTFMHLYSASLAAGVTTLGETGLWARRSLVLDTLERTRASDPRGESAFAVTVFGETERHGESVNPAAGVGSSAVQAQGAQKSSLGGLRVRVQRPFSPEWTMGADLSVITGSADAGYVSSNMGGAALDLSARWRRGALFATAAAGLGYNTFTDYKRRTLMPSIDNTASDPGGVTGSLAFETGRDYALKSVTLTPIVRLAFLDASVGKFTERNLVALSYDRRNLTATTATAELRLRQALSDQATLTGLVGYEGLLAASGERQRAQIANNTAQSFTLNGADLASPGVQIGLGFESRLGTWTGSGQYRASLGAHNQSHRLSAGLATAF